MVLAATNVPASKDAATYPCACESPAASPLQAQARRHARGKCPFYLAGVEWPHAFTVTKLEDREAVESVQKHSSTQRRHSCKHAVMHARTLFGAGCTAHRPCCCRSYRLGRRRLLLRGSTVAALVCCACGLLLVLRQRRHKVSRQQPAEVVSELLVHILPFVAIPPGDTCEVEGLALRLQFFRLASLCSGRLNARGKASWLFLLIDPDTQEVWADRRVIVFM